MLSGLVFILGSCSSTDYPEGLYAELETERGLIVLQLEFEKTPVTVANFVGLAEGRIENEAMPLETPYFDGTVFHRVVPGHVIQAGGPPREGHTGPGYTIPNEIHSDLSHARAGMLGMANGGPHTNGSQFYITLGDRSYLDGDYTVFGNVIRGMDVVEQIAQDDIIRKIRIMRVGKDARDFEVSEENFRSLVEDAARAGRRQPTVSASLPSSRAGGIGRNRMPGWSCPTPDRHWPGRGSAARPTGYPSPETRPSLSCTSRVKPVSSLPWRRL
jgi:peptidylprolyl isomerase